MSPPVAPAACAAVGLSNVRLWRIVELFPHTTVDPAPRVAEAGVNVRFAVAQKVEDVHTSCFGPDVPPPHETAAAATTDPPSALINALTYCTVSVPCIVGP